MTLRRAQEANLNSLLKNKKTESFVLLYHSEWCKNSNAILEMAKEWVEKPGDEVLYVVSSWELPHAFAAFAVTAAPTVVIVDRGKVVVHVEYPKVYDYFSPPKPDHEKGRRLYRPKSTTLLP